MDTQPDPPTLHSTNWMGCAQYSGLCLNFDHCLLLGWIGLGRSTGTMAIISIVQLTSAELKDELNEFYSSSLESESVKPELLNVTIFRGNFTFLQCKAPCSV